MRRSLHSRSISSRRSDSIDTLTRTKLDTFLPSSTHEPSNIPDVTTTSLVEKLANHRGVPNSWLEAKLV